MGSDLVRDLHVVESAVLDGSAFFFPALLYLSSLFEISNFLLSPHDLL